MSLPIQTPVAKASSLIKRFQTTIDSLDSSQSPRSSNPSLKKNPPQIANQHRSVSSGSPRGTPPVIQLKRTPGTPSKSSPFPRSPAADSSPKHDRKIPPSISNSTPNTSPKTSRRSLMPSKLVTPDRTSQLPPEQAAATLKSSLTPRIDQPSDLSKVSPIDQPLDLVKPSPIDQPSDLVKPSSIDQLPDVLKESSTDQLADDLKESIADQPSAVPKQLPSPDPKQLSSEQPSDVVKPSVPRQSGATAKAPVLTAKATKPQPTRASLAVSTQAKAKLTVASDTRNSLSSRKHAAVSASTVAPRVTARESKAAPSTSQPTALDNKTAPVKVVRKSLGTTSMPKNTGIQKTTIKTSAPSNLAKNDESATGTSVIRKARTSLRPVKEPPKNEPVRATKMATTQVAGKTMIPKTKAPAASVATGATPVKKPINPAPAKITKQISVTDSTKAIKTDPKHQSAANATTTLPKKADPKPVQRTRVSVAPSVVGLKKSINPKPTAQSSDKLPTTAGSKLRSSIANKQPDLKTLSSKTRSSLVKAPLNAAKAAKLPTVPASSVRSIQHQDNTTTENEKVPPPASAEDKLELDNTNEDGTQADPVVQSEPPTHAEVEGQDQAVISEEPENKPNQSVDQNEEKPVVCMESKEDGLVGEPEHLEIASQDAGQDYAVPVENESQVINATEDGTHGQPASESEPPSHPLEDQAQDAICEEHDDHVNQLVDQNEVEEPVVSTKSEDDNLVGGKDVVEHDSQHADEDFPAPVEQDSIIESTNEDNNQVKPISLPDSATHSQIQDQDEAASIVEEENQPNQAAEDNQLERQMTPVDSAAGDVVDGSKLETSSHVADQDQTFFPEDQLTSENPNEDDQRAKLLDESVHTVQSEHDQDQGVTSGTLEDATNQMDAEKEVNRENTPPISDSAELVDESKPHSQLEEPVQVPISEEQIDTNQSVDGNFVGTETIPVEPEEAGTVDTEVIPVDSALAESSPQLQLDPQPVDQDRSASCEEHPNEDHLLANEHHMEEAMTENSDALDKKSETNDLNDDIRAHSDDQADVTERDQADSVTPESTSEEAQNETKVEKEDISPDFDTKENFQATEPLDESQPFPIGDEVGVSRSEQLEIEAQPIGIENQGEKVLDSVVSEMSESVYFPQQADQREIPTDFPHQADQGEIAMGIENQGDKALDLANSEISESVGEAQLDHSPRPTDQHEVTKSEPQDYEAIHSVVHDQMEHEMAIVNPELDGKSCVEAVSDPTKSIDLSTQTPLDASPIQPNDQSISRIEDDVAHDQVEQEMATVNPQLEHKSLVEAVSDATKSIDLSTQTPLAASPIQPNDQSISRIEDEYPSATAEKDLLEHTNPDDTQADSGTESESVLFQLEAEDAASESEKREKVDNQLDGQIRDKKESMPPNHEADDLIGESKSESHSQLGEQVQDLISEDAQLDVHQNDIQTVDDISVQPDQQEDQHQDARSEEKQREAHHFATQDQGEPVTIRESSTVAVFSTESPQFHERLASYAEQKNKSAEFVIEDDEEEDTATHLPETCDYKLEANKEEKGSAIDEQAVPAVQDENETGNENILVNSKAVEPVGETTHELDSQLGEEGQVAKSEEIESEAHWFGNEDLENLPKNEVVSAKHQPAESVESPHLPQSAEQGRVLKSEGHELEFHPFVDENQLVKGINPVDSHITGKSQFGLDSLLEPDQIKRAENHGLEVNHPLAEKENTPVDLEQDLLL